MFLSRITSELQIPVLALVDADPYGLKILSVYMSGSKNMSYDSASLTTPDIKWLGLRPSDLNKWVPSGPKLSYSLLIITLTSSLYFFRYDLPDQCRLKMTDTDIKTGKELLQEAFIMKNPEWMKELQIMVSFSDYFWCSYWIDIKCSKMLTSIPLQYKSQVKTKEKAEIQALSSFGFQYVTEEYLPRKWVTLMYWFVIIDHWF